MKKISILIISILFQIFAIYICYFAEGGAPASLLVILFISVSVLFFLGIIFKPLYKVSLVIILLADLLTVPFQIINSIELYQIQNIIRTEIQNLEEKKTLGKPIPTSIDTLFPQSPDIAKHIQSYDVVNNEISVRYYVKSPSTSYVYSSKEGWSYEDD